MAKSPAFQFYVNDFLGSAKVGMMSTEEIGAYTLLLCLDWQEDGFLYDLKRLAKWCRLSQKAFARAWVQVGECFAADTSGRLRNPRLQEERAKQEAWREKSAKGAAETNKRRRDNGRGSDEMAPIDITPHGRGGGGMATEKSTNGDRTPLPSSTPSPFATPVTASSSPSADVARLLDSLPTDTMRLSWRAEINAAREGMHGPPLTDEQIDRAARDYVGNGHSGEPSLRHFRAFLSDAARPPTAPRVISANGANGFDTPAMRQWAIDDEARRAKEKARA